MATALLLFRLLDVELVSSVCMCISVSLSQSLPLSLSHTVPRVCWMCMLADAAGACLCRSGAGLAGGTELLKVSTCEVMSAIAYLFLQLLRYMAGRFKHRV